MRLIENDVKCGVVESLLSKKNLVIESACDFRFFKGRKGRGVAKGAEGQPMKLKEFG